MEVLEIKPYVEEEITLKRPDKALSKLTLEDVMNDGHENGRSWWRRHLYQIVTASVIAVIAFFVQRDYTGQFEKTNWR